MNNEDLERAVERSQALRARQEKLVSLHRQSALLRRLSMILVLASAAAALGTLAEGVFKRWLNLTTEVTLPEKIRTLTESLNKSARTIADIEKEMQERQTLVTRLQRDAETAERLAKINKEQVDAIAQTLQGELERRERGSFWWSNALNLFYVLLGVALDEIVRLVKRRWWGT